MATIIEITVAENVTAAFDRLEEFERDKTPAMQDIASMMVAATKLNFLGQHDPLGVPWKKRLPLPGKADLPHPLLRKSGNLFASLRENAGPDFAEAGFEASAGAGIYARIHQLGGTIRPKQGKKALNTPFGFLKSVTIPARPSLGNSPNMERKTIDILVDHLQGVFSASATGAPGAGVA